MKKVISSLRIPLLLVIISIPLILPYFHPGYFPTHDGEWAVVRLSDMYREIRDGQFPARFSGNLNFSYGYPLFNFAYPLPYYLGLTFFLLHFGLVNSIKILFALSVPLSAIGMYFAAYKLFGSRFSAVISAVLYIFLPYRVVDLYVRGSIGESIASILFPLIILSMAELKDRKSKWYITLLAISFASLILVHNIMATYGLIIIAVYGLTFLFPFKKEAFLRSIVGLLLGLGLSAFFWLPALAEKHLILLSQIPIADRNLYYVPLSKLLYSPFGYGTPTESHPFTYEIGLVHVVLFFIVIGLAVFAYLKKKQYNLTILLFSLLLFFFFFLLFPVSAFIWKYTPLLKEINYPWTLLFPIGFLVSLLAGSLKLSSLSAKGVILLLVIISSLFVVSIAHPSSFVDRGDGFYFTNDATTTSSHELMPLSVHELPTSRPEKKVEIVSGKGEIQMEKNKSQIISFKATLPEKSTIKLNTIYFPGWMWYEKGNKISFSYNNSQGIMESVLPKGTHDVVVKFEDTPVRSLANILSCLSILALILYGAIPRIGKKI